jgi:hypothetical protein
LAIETGDAGDQAPAPAGVDLKEAAAVDQGLDQGMDVIGDEGRRRHDGSRVRPLRGLDGRLGAGKQVEHLADLGDAGGIVRGQEAGHAAGIGVHRRPAELVQGAVAAGRHLDDGRAGRGREALAGDHPGEVRQTGQVSGHP